ncbi:ZIP family metal transporter [Zobellella maritima]|uniref:ZIP family metal transporter n=1 Tax=Zobellella maritima TaxID=2059725 RepID=UPI000E30225A|nr:divalent cation transporter [Zobellella maritima]
MSELMMIVAFTLLAGMAMPLGALIACVERIHPAWLENEFRHSVIAFGGGALLSAVALVLVPDGIGSLDPVMAALCFCGGGLAFMTLDIVLFKLRTPASQLSAMLSDFIPESLALGAAFAMGASGSGVLLAVLMALQNLPEGFNAFRELNASSGYSRFKIIALFALMALCGPAAGLSGYLWLAESPSLVAGIMLFASGGILYSVFQDIAPQAVLDRHWAPPMGAVLGFILGMVGHMVTLT